MKQTLLVAEKISTMQAIQNAGVWDDGWAYDYYGSVVDTWSLSPPFCKHEDGWYLHGKRSRYEPLCLPDAALPEDRYLKFVSKKSIAGSRYRNGLIKADDIGQILFAITDTCTILGARSYLERIGWIGFTGVSCISLPDMPEDMDKAFCLPQPFLSVYEKELERIQEETGPIYTPFEQVMKQADMTLTEFCRYFKLKRRTAENWKYGICPCPAYVLELFQYKLRKEGLI